MLTIRFDRLGLAPGDRVLDVGAGFGRHVFECARRGTDVVALELGDGAGTAKVETEAGVETVAFSLPAVITCQKGLNEPHYAGLKGIMAAKKKPLEEAAPEVPENLMSVAEVALPPERKEGRIVGEGADAVPALIDALRNEAKAL